MKPKPYEYQPDVDTYHWDGYPQPPSRFVIWTIRMVVVVGALAILLCAGCVTAPNSNQSTTINLFSSHSRYGQTLGGTNNVVKGQIEGGGALTATLPMTP